MRIGYAWAFHHWFESFLVNLLVKHAFVNVVEYKVCNLKFFFAVAFIYVCLEVAHFSLVFACIGLVFTCVL